MEGALLKVERDSRVSGRLDAPTLADARISERTDLQKCIYNSGIEFFAEIGAEVFVLGKEVVPSQAAPDRIDLLGIRAKDAIDVSADLMGTHGVPEHIRSDNHPAMIAKRIDHESRSCVNSL